MLNEVEISMNPLKKISTSGLMWAWVTLLVIALDRYSKTWVLDHLTLYQPFKILPIFNFTLAYNKGAAFNFLNSMSGWQNWFLGGLAAIVSIMGVVWLTRIPARAWWMSIALCLILGGALGNAWDRVLYGYVIDFLSFHLGDWYFAIFNVADSAICVGACMLFLYWFKQEK